MLDHSYTATFLQVLKIMFKKDFHLQVSSQQPQVKVAPVNRRVTENMHSACTEGLISILTSFWKSRIGDETGPVADGLAALWFSRMYYWWLIAFAFHSSATKLCRNVKLLELKKGYMVKTVVQWCF